MNFVVVAAQNGERREGDRGMVVAERNVDPSCRNVSNPYHQCAEYCSPRSPQVKELNGEKRSGLILSWVTDCFVITDNFLP